MSFEVLFVFALILLAMFTCSGSFEPVVALKLLIEICFVVCVAYIVEEDTGWKGVAFIRKKTSMLYREERYGKKYAMEC